ncbi:testis-specific serine/threonine-protein kinase 1-like protein 1 [Leptotrombidium deliense]|uniref:non-specific serine/threonine protein kinase n=1 Tax=Leptotrombidium deliense TaxID=299467 RepID=A0A443SNH5_9ACAR|nr:testis-specific serine/threonine-protein kinase 1-like protein 1 [Leptotrombidium deliense]
MKEAEFQDLKKQKETELRMQYSKQHESKHKKDLKQMKGYYKKKYPERMEESTKDMSKMEKIPVLQTEEALYTRYHYNITALKMEKGAYSVFCKAKRGSDSMVVKITDLKKAPKSYKKCLVEGDSYKAIKWLMKNRNAFVISCTDVFLIGDKFYFFQEVLAENLESHLKHAGVAEEDKARQIIRDVGEGLVFLHTNGIAHRDLCARNVMVDKTAKTVKIGGFSCVTGWWTKEPKKLPGIHDKDVKYISPEERDGGDICPVKADIWGLGATAVYAMCKDYPPAVEFEVFQSNKLGHASEDFVDLMKKTFGKPKNRPTAIDFLSHHWFKVYANVLK